MMGQTAFGGVGGGELVGWGMSIQHGYGWRSSSKDCMAQNSDRS